MYIIAFVIVVIAGFFGFRYLKNRDENLPQRLEVLLRESIKANKDYEEWERGGGTDKDEGKRLREQTEKAWRKYMETYKTFNGLRS